MAKPDNISLLHTLRNLRKKNQTTDAKQTNCTISAKTVKPVDRCPTTEEDWRKAAVVKNCSAYASLCNDSKTYVYHCLVNAYVNQTVEVCAIQINIVGGFCPLFSSFQKKLQSNYETNCTIFPSKPCPEVYISYKVYKFPDCFQLKMTLATTTESPSPKPYSNSLSISDIETTTNRNIKKDGNAVIWTYGPIVLAILLLCFCVLVGWLIVTGNWRKYLRPCGTSTEINATAENPLDGQINEEKRDPNEDQALLESISETQGMMKA
uniref:Uncharacterized protein LOC111103775 n=1 Tax=Crassostrea virginica TaxID=6565 RepID=A0A8B8ARW6_CRAVI|nr:uncharacterized protein LOC111103775 [Crassostrea virginica]